MAQDDAIAKLARQIDTVRKAERYLVNADEVASLRRHGACELHRTCADFVSSVNSNLSEAGTAHWRFFNWRSRHTGPVDHGLLVKLMKPLF